MKLDKVLIALGAFAITASLSACAGAGSQASTTNLTLADIDPMADSMRTANPFASADRPFSGRPSMPTVIPHRPR